MISTIIMFINIISTHMGHYLYGNQFDIKVMTCRPPIFTPSRRSCSFFSYEQLKARAGHAGQVALATLESRLLANWLDDSFTPSFNLIFFILDASGTIYSFGRFHTQVDREIVIVVLINIFFCVHYLYTTYQKLCTQIYTSDPSTGTSNVMKIETLVDGCMWHI